MNRTTNVRTLLLGALGVAASLAATSAANAQGDGYGISYSVTVTNLTKAVQFTPLAAASHTRAIALFELGQPASAALAEVAEEGSNRGAGRGARGQRGPSAASPAPKGCCDPGASVTFTLEASHRTRLFSMASMLLPTNDTFVALDSVRLPYYGTRTFRAAAYDAGNRAERRDLRQHSRPRVRRRRAFGGRLERRGLRAHRQRRTRSRRRLDRVERSGTRRCTTGGTPSAEVSITRLY